MDYGLLVRSLEPMKEMPHSAVVSGVLEPSFGSSRIVLVALGFLFKIGLLAHSQSVPVHKCLSDQETNATDAHRRD